GAMTITGLVLALLVADSRRAERRLQIQEAVSRILTEATTLKQAVSRILQAVCQEGAWDWAAIWAHDYGTQRLTCVGVWYDRPTGFASFEGATCQVTPEVSLSFAADVLKRGARSFMLDANTGDDFPRASVAIAAGFRSLLFVPVRMGERLLGLIELFSCREIKPDKEALQMLEAIGSQVGQFIERKEVEEARTGLAAIVESSLDAIVGKTLEGIITSWNKGAERIFGYSAEEVLGKSIALIIPPDRLEEET